MDTRQDKIVSLLEQAEKDLADDPKLYERKLFRYSLLGYGIILTLVVLLVGIVVGSVLLALSSSLFLLLLLKKKLVIPLFIMIWVLFRSVFIRWPKPEGVVLTREHFPALFDIIDELRQKLDAPTIHQVLITPEFNAAIIQTPRFLAFGFTHNTLILGFELLVSLSADELKSVLAHELAHLSGNHSKFHGWIYQARESWQNMMYNLDQHNGWTTAPIRKFFNWYSPRFSAYSFALARLNEYEADSVSAELCSNSVASSALLKLPAYSHFIQDKHWDTFNHSVLEVSQPKTLPYAGLIQFMAANKIEYAEAQTAIEHAKKETTNYQDTHPCLTDRLAALKGEGVVFTATNISAATELFKDKISDVAAMLDKQWQQVNAEAWRDEFERAQQEKTKLQSLKSIDLEELSKDDLWQRAVLTEKFGLQPDPIELFRVFNQRYPEDQDGQFALGRLSLGRGDESGLALLESAASKNELLEISSRVAYGYLIDKERQDEAEVWLQKMYSLEQLYRAAGLERQAINTKDYIEPTTVSEDVLEEIITQIKQHKKVKAAWVAQKRVENFVESQVLIFAIQPKRGFYLSDNLAEKVISSLEITSDNVVFVLTKSVNKNIYNRVKALGQQVI